MNAIILDTNILIKYPKILSLKIPETDIFTTTDVLSEVGYRAENSVSGTFTFTGLLGLLKNAIDANTLAVNPIAQKDIDIISNKLRNSPRLSYVDKTIIALGAQISHAYEKVSIATLDSAMQKSLGDFEINVLTADQIEDLINQNKQTNNPALEKLAEQYEKSVNNKFFQGILIGIAVTALIFLLYFNFKAIIETINIWGTISLSIVLGVALFIFRERQRLSYGIFEFLSGMGTIILIFYPKFNYSSINYTFDFYVKLLGGLYIMVRGQDNIIKSLQGKKWGFWIKEKTGIG